MADARILPLTELRRAFLQTLLLGFDTHPEWATPTLTAWARRSGAAVMVPSGYEITILGRKALEVDTKHGYTLKSRFLGASPIKGWPASYGTTLRCRCGWTHENNETPTKGGNKRAKAEHQAHLAKLLDEIMENGS